MIDGVRLTPLKIISSPGGAVRHGLRLGDPGFVGFGEAYFSTVESDAIKAWKCHRRVTLNIVVPLGKVRFVIFDDREGSSSRGEFHEHVLSDQENYQRLTVPPGLWFGFEGLADGPSLLMNIIDLPHDHTEADVLSLYEIPYKSWLGR